MTTQRGRHRKLRRNIARTVVAISLLSGIFTTVDQSINLTSASAAAGEPGTVDATFANVAAITGIKYSLGVQSDGKVIATPDYGLPIVRYNVDGTVDSSFTFTAASATAVKVNPADDSFFVTRFATATALVQKRLGTGLTGTGTWDSTLKGRGNYVHSMEFIYANDLLVLSNSAPGLVKLNIATGAQDIAFNTNLSASPFVGFGQQVKIQTVGGVKKILVAASNGNFGGSLTRYNLDGTLDKVIYSNKDFVTVEVVNVAGQNMIVAGERTDGVLHVFNEDGTIATNQYAQNIKAATNAFGPTGLGLGPRTIAVDSSGRIVVGGSFTSPTKYLFRFNSDGTADTTFNTNIGTTFSSKINEISISTGDKIYVASDSGVVRILGEYANPGPNYTSGTVSADGLTLTLNFAVDLGAMAPATNLFAVSNGGTAVVVNSASVSGKQVVLDLASPIGAGKTLSVVYSPPARDDATTNAVIQTVTGGDALKFTAFNASITNNSTADQLGPVYTPASASLAADGVTLTLSYNEPLNATTAAGSSFAVVSGGVARTVSSVAVSGSNLILTLAQGGGSGATVTVAYTAPTANSATSNAAVQDALGNDALSFTATAVVNNSTLDKVSPVFTPSSAVLSADGVTLTLTYNEPLNATTALASAFTVIAGTVRTVSTVAVSGSTVVLTLSTAIGSGISTSVSYTAPTANEASSNNAIQDTAGNDAATLAAQSVTNNSTVDRVSPTYVAASAAVATDGMSITLTYNEALSPVTATPTAFSVISGGLARTVTSVAVDDKKVILYFASPLAQTVSTTVSYTAPATVIGTSNAAIQDIAGNDAVTLAAQSAVNNSNVDATGPAYVAGSAVIDATGLKITLTYNEALNARTADPSAFTVTSGFSTRSVTDVTVSGSSVVLTLASPVAVGATTTVSYTAPTASTLISNLAIQDSIGNDGVSLSSIAITNNSTVDFTVAPNLTGLTAPTTSKIVLSFDKTLNATTAATTDFNVTSAGIPITVSGVTVIGSTVELTLASAMSTSYQTFVTYTAPTSDASTSNSAIQSTIGNDGASFVKQAVDLLAAGSTITEVVTSPTAAPGTQVDLIARMPFTQTGSTSQEIVQQIDPTVIQLTGIEDIAYPNGWTLSFCSGLTTDCTVAGNFSTTVPATAAAWALVKAVKATGNVVSDGTSGGNLIATATATDTSPRQGTFTPAGTSTGDGWIVDFDNRGNVYNMYHHDGNNNYNEAGLDCHTRSGAVCAGSWPFYLRDFGLHSNGKSYIYVDDATNKIYFPTTKTPGISTAYGATDVSMGVACIDVSTNTAPKLCGGSVATGYVPLRTATYTTHKGSSTWAVAGTKIYLNDLQTGKLSCFDYSTNAACPGQPFAINGVTSSDESNSDLRNIGGLLYGSAPNVAFCFNPTTNSACTGWETSKPLPDFSYRIVELPDASGTTVAACFLYGINATPSYSVAATTKGARCFTSAGAAYTTNIDWLTTYLGPSQGDWFPNGISNDPEVNGTKIYWSNNARFEKMRYFCWDVSLNAGVGGVCPNFPIVSSEAVSVSNPYNYVNTSYTLVLDPLNANCIWVDNDRNRITTYDAVTGQLGCTSPPSTVTFSGATTVPRLSCTDENGVRAWRNVTLKTPGVASYSAVKLTVFDSAGNAVAGYTDITTSLTNASGQKYWDLTGLPVSLTGQTPNFKVQFLGLTSTTDASISISAEGGSPQLCLSPTTIIKCPVGVGVLDPADLTATTANVTGSGSSTVGATTTALTSSTSTIDVAAPSISDCTSSLLGRAGYSGNGGTGGPVPGATVTLLNASGQPVLDDLGNPITTVTDADGRYAFNNLFPGSYQVAFDAPVGKALLSATTVSGAAGSTFATTSTNTSSVTATTSAVAVGTFAVVNSLYMASMTANPDVTSGFKGEIQTINLLTNTNGADVPSQGATVVTNSVKLCDTTETSPNCTKTSVTVSGVGTYNVDATGVMTFTPLANYIGTPAPLAYTVLDSAGGTGASTYTPTVVGPPTATANTTSGPLNVAQSVNVLTNDTPGTNGTFVASSLALACPATPTTPTCIVNGDGSVTVTGQGTYTKGTDGTVTFTPVNNYSGTPTPVKYTVTDSTGQTATSTYTPTIIPPPSVVPDTSTGPWDTNQTRNVVTNTVSTGDSAAAGTTLVAGSIRLCAPADTAPNCTTDASGSVVIANQGTYTIDPTTNVITFDPLPTFIGTATPVRYSITDAEGQKSSTTYTPTVTEPPVPTSNPDTISLIAGSSLPFSSIFDGQTGDNDTALATKGTGAPDLTNATVCIIDPATTVCDTDGIVVIAGEGTYTLDPATGIVTYAADANATSGAKTPVTYKISDDLGRSVTNTLTPTIYPRPTATNDTSSGAYDTDQTISPFSNDGNVPGHQLGSLKLCGNNPVQTPNNCDKPSITTADGVYTVVGNTVVFNPDPDFVGLATEPVRYQAIDDLNQYVNALITPTVVAPAPPAADPETTTGRQGAPQTTDLLVGDTTAAVGITLVPSSVKLCDPTTDPAQVAPNCTLTTLVVPNVGSYTVVNGVMTFTPEPAFTGTPAAVEYQVTDTVGGVATSTYTPTVVPGPVAVLETTTGAKGAPQSINLLTNDSAASGATLDPTSVKLCDPTANPAEVAPNCTATSVSVPGVGTYTVDNTGKMTFTPDANYVGTPTPLPYTVTDSLGSKATATYAPTVIGTPTAVADTTSGPQGVAQSINVVTNSAGTSDSAATGTTLAISSVSLSCAGAADCTRNVNGTVTIANQGTYSAVSADGTVVFTPVPTFVGTATPVTYTVSDALGQSATTTYTPTVIPAPVAVNDTSTNGQDKNQVINVLTNDTVPTNPPGDPLDQTSVKLCGTNPVQTPAACDKLTLTTADGTYTVDPATGLVTFDPIPTFTGTVTVPVRYQVSDTGTTPQTTSALITPVVIPGPAAVNDATSGPMNTAQSISLVTNDSAANGATLDAASVKLCDPNAPAEVAPNCTKTSVTVPGVGTYTVSSTGVMTFTPVTGYSGTPAPLTYTVADNFGVKATATYTPTVIPAPTVVPDTSTGPWDTNQTRNVITNNVNTGDSAAAGTTLAAGSIRLCASSDTAPNCTVDASGSVVIANQGTYTLDPTTGVVTFDPLPTFTGTATPVTYSVTDALGQKSSTTYTPTVTVPPAPTATPDTVSLIAGATKAFSSIFDGQTGDSDVALATKATGGPDLTNATVCIVDPATGICGTTDVVIAGEGTYHLDPVTGIVTYTSLSTATSGPKTPISYKITDGLGRTVTSTLTPTVEPRPIARPDSSTGVQGQVQTLSPVTNDSPGGQGSTTLFPDTRVQVPSGIFLCAANQPPPDCQATTVDVYDNNVKLGVLSVSASGLVTFVPEPNFIGTTPPIGYQIPDNLGQKAYSTITITVVAPPSAAATLDTGSAAYNQPVTLSPWLNDSPGVVPAGSSVAAPILDRTTIRLCAIDDPTTLLVNESQLAPNCTELSVTTVEGTYVVNPLTGVVVFTPVPGFVGTVANPPTYQITNTWSGIGGPQTVTALLVPTIAPPGAPVAAVDVTTTKPGISVIVNPVSNDTPGSAALNPLTIKLCGVGEIAPTCSQMQVTTVDGTYVVDPDTGKVMFTPRDGFTGQATLPYVITDMLGMVANSNIIITVEADAKIVPVVHKKKTGLAQTGGHRPDLLLLFALLAFAAAGGLRFSTRRR